MARVNRNEVLDPSEVELVHAIGRTVRDSYLLGKCPTTGKNYDHRKDWIEAILARWAACFGIDLIAFSLMSTHMHLVLRSRPDVVDTWDDTEVARRWLSVCPVRKNKDGSPKEPSEAELNAICNDPKKLAKLRLRLSDVSWWMRLVCQRIAQRANREDEMTGHFWHSRYRAIKLLDEAAILACAAYVDLNPIRAALAETIEDSRFTSAYRRVQALLQDVNSVSSAEAESESAKASEFEESRGAIGEASKDLIAWPRFSADGFLAPVAIGVQPVDGHAYDQVGPMPSSTGRRCSDKGFAAMTTADYLQLLDWTARQIVPGKRGSTPVDLPPIFQRLQISSEAWCELVRDFEKYFSLVAGMPENVDNYRSRVSQRSFELRPSARDLLATG